LKKTNLSPIELLETRSPGPPSPADRARRRGPIGVPLPDHRSDAAGFNRFGRQMARWAAALALLGLGAGAGYWFLAPPAVAVVHPHRGMAVQAVYATGTVEPSVMVPIAPRISARLAELLADEGAVVAKGQVLARLEDDDLRRAVDALDAEARYAKAEFDRLGVLVERQVVTRSAYDRARADWDKARAAAARATAEAGFLQLVAPADGTIIRRDGEIGQLVGPSQTVFWLRCCAPLRISTEVDEEDIGQVRPGQQVLIRSDAFPGQIFHGEVQAVTPKGDPVARSYRVRISLPADTPLMVGMTTETNIVLRQDEHALLIPAGAIRQDTAWVVEDGRLVPHRVVLGAKGATEVEIIDGLGEGDWIVAQPSASLKAGQEVRPRPPAEQR
jgi:multidrug efflux system membrane fusion protein